MAPGPVIRVGNLDLRLLGLQIGSDGSEVYEISFRSTPQSDWQRGQLRHAGDTSWILNDGESDRRLVLCLPDDLFVLASGDAAVDAELVQRAVPHWPSSLQHRLTARRSAGACTLAFDGPWFKSRLAEAPFDRPLILPGATVRLGLSALDRSSQSLRRAVAAAADLLDLLESALPADGSAAPSRWTGEGRLIGASTWGDLSQTGADIATGCRAARGTGRLDVTFDPGQPMGIGFAPEVPTADVVASSPASGGDSVGTGLEVGEVDPGSMADARGVTAGMRVRGISGQESDVDGASQPFESLLDAVDAHREAGTELVLTFDTAAPLTGWYAVEMPADPVLEAFSTDRAPREVAIGAEFEARCGDALLWREPIARLFLGAPGSVTSAHVDICPQLQIAHGLLGTKVLGVATHVATPRLSEAFGGSIDGILQPPTHVPTDRPLDGDQSALLRARDVSLVLLLPGDLVVLDSGALHFASNGAAGPSGAVYHGVMTAGALPRLRQAAASAHGRHGQTEDGYEQHLHAADLLERIDSGAGHP